MALLIFSPSLIEADLNNLTIKDLKLLCKERHLTGYSKFTKSALISKILDSKKFQLEKGTGMDSVATTTSSQANFPQDLDNSSQLRVQDATALLPPRTYLCVDLNNTQSVDLSDVTEGFVPQAPMPILGSMRAPDDVLTLQLLARENKTFTFDKAVLGVSQASSIKRSRTVSEAGIEFPERKKATGAPSNQRFPRAINGSEAKGSRFKRLIPKLQSTQGRAETEIMSHTQQLDTPPASYLDVVLESALQLLPISLPPSMAQRKHVPRLSLLLSKITVDDLKACALVSRLFRYCAYSTAYNQLVRNFQGSRLKGVLSEYQVNVSNFWPYLIYRMDKIEKRKKAYEMSFVGRTLKDMYLISENIWTSPDNPKQAHIAMRLLETKLEAGSYQKIIGVDEVVSEIWKITVQSSSSIHEYHVVEATCEVIGHHTEDAISRSIDSGRLRLDWASYIKSRSHCAPNSTSSEQVVHPELLKYLNWTNHEEYEKGISKMWLSKIEKEGNTGMAKLAIAQRYIIACVVNNSISGPQLTANQMFQEHNGIAPKTTNIGMTTKNQRIRLFLPAHHLLESLHFDSSNRKPLHEALAVVQTPARQNYILRDNGMQIGSEEDGVAHVWMAILGCKNDGSI